MQDLRNLSKTMSSDIFLFGLPSYSFARCSVIGGDSIEGTQELFNFLYMYRSMIIIFWGKKRQHL